MTNFNEEQKQFISALLDELKGEEATESDGWKNAKEKSCCPGDDWADGFNFREQELRNKIEEIKKNL